jgi:hypothetical protein
VKKLSSELMERQCFYSVPICAINNARRSTWGLSLPVKLESHYMTSMGCCDVKSNQIKSLCWTCAVTQTYLSYVGPGSAKSIVCIAQVVPQPVRTSGNFQELTLLISYWQVKKCFR